MGNSIIEKSRVNNVREYLTAEDAEGRRGKRRIERTNFRIEISD
jgi:hypothetical protein